MSRQSLQKYWHQLFEVAVFIKGFNGLWQTTSGVLLLFFLHNFWGTKTFVGVYLLIHGLLNIFLAIQLYRDRHWAYLVTIGTVIIFMIYQIYRISAHHSIILTAITIFDAFFIIIAWHEYKYHRDK